MQKSIAEMREDAVKIFNKGVYAVEPRRAVKKFCRRDKDYFYAGSRKVHLPSIENLYIIGAGKGAAPMAAAIEELLSDYITDGIINVKYGHKTRLDKIKLVEAGHPLPDKNGEKGTKAMLELVKNAGDKDLVLFLVSGGGSALLPLPVDGITLKDKQNTIAVLLECGASIDEINAIRKHISSIKGGRLAKIVYPAPIVSIILSDVVGDDLEVIASGPTVPDSSTFFICADIIAKYNIEDKLPLSVSLHIKNGLRKKEMETPKADDPVFSQTSTLIIGNNMEAIAAAKKEADNMGYNSIILSSMIEGETKDVARVHAAIAKEIHKTGNPLPLPACVLSGGETTVRITGNGKGGRNQEFSLAAALDITGNDKIVLLSGGTDGNDGPTDAAGGIADNTTLTRAENLCLNPYDYLSNNDSYNFLKKLDDLLITGPTNTNVMDLRVMIVA